MALRIGVVGVGFGSAVHIPAFQSEGLEVAAVCSRREERVRAAADKFGIAHAFSDYAEMLRLPGLDAVSVVSPVPLHHSMTMAALEAGKHVICEKPFTIDARLALEMWQKAQATGLTAMIAHEFRFASARARALRRRHPVHRHSCPTATSSTGAPAFSGGWAPTTSIACATGSVRSRASRAT
jgi:predicted dehydrogenase